MQRKKLKRREQPFVAKVLDQLRHLDDVQCRPMFGCYGLYQSNTFFGIICGDNLFFRTDEQTRRKYMARRMEPFVFREHQKEHFYYRVPLKIIASEEDLCAWATEAVQVQQARQFEKLQSSQSRRAGRGFRKEVSNDKFI